MLVLAAARRWDVEPVTCETRLGFVLHNSSQRCLPYGVLVSAAAKLTVPTDVTLKEAIQYSIIGKPTRQLDATAIVHGTQRFGLDTRVPGMRFASIERAPVFGARIVTVDDRAARAIAGVIRVVRTRRLRHRYG
jgi:isoquinoline 1-oxidoreductase subunit beta